VFSDPSLDCSEYMSMERAIRRCGKLSILKKTMNEQRSRNLNPYFGVGMFDCGVHGVS
jgi:hypothetical protein